MINTSQFKNGIAIQLDGHLYTIVEFQHIKPGKGPAFVRTKIRRLDTNTVVEKTFRAGERVEDVFLDEKPMQYLYRDGDTYHFMEQNTYEQFEFTSDQLGETHQYLLEGAELAAVFHGQLLVEVKPPMFVELTVQETEPGFRGDTSKAGMKPATLETGASIKVPLFVDTGDCIRIDTRTGEYVARV